MSHSTFTLLPGQRLLHGQPYTFNQDLVNATRADLRVAEGLPIDLSTLTDADLTSAFYAFLNAVGRRRHDPEVEAFGAAVCNERARREAQTRAA